MKIRLLEPLLKGIFLFVTLLNLVVWAIFVWPFVVVIAPLLKRRRRKKAELLSESALSGLAEILSRLEQILIQANCSRQVEDVRKLQNLIRSKKLSLFADEVNDDRLWGNHEALWEGDLLEGSLTAEFQKALITLVNQLEAGKVAGRQAIEVRNLMRQLP
jgi:hypothetical protein